MNWPKLLDEMYIVNERRGKENIKMNDFAHVLDHQLKVHIALLLTQAISRNIQPISHFAGTISNIPLIYNDIFSFRLRR